MGVDLKSLNPPPVVLNIYNRRGKLKEELHLRSQISLSDEVWINAVAFPTNKTQDNGLQVLADRLKTGRDPEAVYIMIHRLLIGDKYKCYKKFEKRFRKARNTLPAFYQALELIFRQSQPENRQAVKGEKKSPQIGRRPTTTWLQGMATALINFILFRKISFIILLGLFRMMMRTKRIFRRLFMGGSLKSR